jgi:flagellin
VLHLQVGSLPGQSIDLNTFKLSASDLGIDGLDVSSFASAGDAIDKIDKAIDSVSDMRSYYGALQNRLEHTMANLDNTSENTQSAESQIRDTDMADTMVSYSKDNILQQAGQTILAQANQQTQGVLNLLNS